MSFASLLIDECTVRRFTPGAPDDYGRPVKAWHDVLVDEPCRLASAGGREIQVGAEVVVADYKLFIEDEDVTEQDRIEFVETIPAFPIPPFPPLVTITTSYEVLLVERRKDSVTGHHKECLLKAVR